MTDRVIVYADKTMLRVRGVSVRGLRPEELEATLAAHLQTPVRVIGVTGDSVDMDVYGLGPDAILRDPSGVIKAVSTVEGILASDLARIEAATRTVDVDIDNPPPATAGGCRKERWCGFAQESGDCAHRG